MDDPLSVAQEREFREQATSHPPDGQRADGLLSGFSDIYEKITAQARLGFEASGAVVFAERPWIEAVVLDARPLAEVPDRDRA